MQYKLYHYELTMADGRLVGPDNHHNAFRKSTGRDDTGRFTEYRGRRDTVLMYVRKYGSDFAGLIGRHSTEREITEYKEALDETLARSVGDDDYPHAAFICMPRLRMIACVDSGQIKADSAMMRLHQILAHRQHMLFHVSSITETYDLRRAVRKFRLVEVEFEIYPVNPHTGDLGEQLDAANKRDHIRKLIGRAEGKPSDPLKIDGGFLTAVQELQQSGHAKVGFTALTEKNLEVKVPKPRRANRCPMS